MKQKGRKTRGREIDQEFTQNLGLCGSHVEIGRTSGSQLNFVSEGGAVGEDSWIASSFYYIMECFYPPKTCVWLHILKNKITLYCVSHEHIVI